MVNLKFSPQDDMYTDDAFLRNYRFIFLQDLFNDSNTFFLILFFIFKTKTQGKYYSQINLINRIWTDINC